MTASKLQQLRNLRKAGGSDFKEDALATSFGLLDSGFPASRIVVAGDLAGDGYRGFKLQSLHSVTSVS